jgi:hypothetical protein
VPIDEDLRDAVKDYQRFTAHEAKPPAAPVHRQVDAQRRSRADRAALDAFKGVSATETARMHRLEGLRTRLLEDEKTLHGIAEDLSGCRPAAAARTASQRDQGKGAKQAPRALIANFSACCANWRRAARRPVPSAFDEDLGDEE